MDTAPGGPGSNNAPSQGTDVTVTRHRRSYDAGGDLTSYSQFRGHGTPSDVLGVPGDIYIDITHGAYRIFVKYASWIEWPGVKKWSTGVGPHCPATISHPTLFHPNDNTMVIWCSDDDVLWYRKANLQKVRSRLFRRSGKDIISAREMIERTGKLAKEIAAVEEEVERARAVRGSTPTETHIKGAPSSSADCSHAIESKLGRAPSPEGQALAGQTQVQSCSQELRAPDRRYKLRPRVPARRPSPLASGARPLKKKDYEYISEDRSGEPERAETHDEIAIMERVKMLKENEGKETAQLEELGVEYKQRALEIEAARKEEERTGREALEQKREELRIKELEAVGRKKEIMLLKEIRLHQERELDDIRRSIIQKREMAILM